MNKAERAKQVEAKARVIIDDNQGEVKYFYAYTIGMIRAIVTAPDSAKKKMEDVMITLEALDMARKMERPDFSEGGERTG